MGQGYKHLCLDERIEIENRLDRGQSLTMIAAQLGRAVSTISREIAKGTWLPINENTSYRPYRTSKLTGPWLDARYAAGPSQRRATTRASRSHQCQCRSNSASVLTVEKCVTRKELWSDYCE